MIVYGSLFQHAVMWDGVDGKQIVGIFPTERAAVVFQMAAMRDAPSQLFEVITLDDYERLHCMPIIGKALKTA